MTDHEMLRELAQRMADGTANTVDASRLSELLRTRPELMDEYLAFQSTHAALCWEFREAAAFRQIARFVDSSPKGHGTNSIQSPWRSRRTALGWFTAAATIGFVAFTIGRWENSAFASAATLVRAAIATHSERIERVYLVRATSIAPATSPDEVPFEVRVATQGNAFYVEMSHNKRKWFWGRDDDQAIWIASAKHDAIRIDESEVGLPLQFLSDLYSLQLESLLDQLVRYCNLQHEVEPSGIHVITATPRRRWRTRIQEVTIEIDRDTKVVRRLTIQRSLPASEPSTVTFTLIDSRTPEPEKYRSEGHLTKPYKILTRDTQPDPRRDLLVTWFGAEASEWIKPSVDR